MYSVFFDESGTSINESRLVVAGVLVHGDTQWKPLLAALDDLREKYITKEQRPIFRGFHATDMFEGRGKVFGQHIRPLEESREILRQLVRLPSRFRLPVAFGYVPKADTPGSLKTPRAKRESAAKHHALAACYCILMADDYLKRHRPDDVAVAIAEDNTAHKQVVSDIKALAQQAGTGMEGFDMMGDGTSFTFRWRAGDFPLSKIVSGYHFAAKPDEPLLQLADACAFVVRRWLQGTDTEKLFDILTLDRSCQAAGFGSQYVGNGIIMFA